MFVRPSRGVKRWIRTQAGDFLNINQVLALSVSAQVNHEGTAEYVVTGLTDAYIFKIKAFTAKKDAEKFRDNLVMEISDNG